MNFSRGSLGARYGPWCPCIDGYGLESSYSSRLSGVVRGSGGPNRDCGASDRCFYGNEPTLILVSVLLVLRSGRGAMGCGGRWAAVTQRVRRRRPRSGVRDATRGASSLDRLRPVRHASTVTASSRAYWCGILVLLA